MTCRRAPFFEGYKFVNGARKGVRGNYFHETTLTELFTIHMNLHVMEFPLIFGERNFMEVPRICEIRKIYGPRKKCPTVLSIKNSSYIIQL